MLRLILMDFFLLKVKKNNKNIWYIKCREQPSALTSIQLTLKEVIMIFYN